jgi:hypothetical protein
MSGCDHTCSALAEFKECEHLGHVRFTREVEPAVNKVQPARDQGPNDPLASLLGQLNRRYRQSPIYPPTSSNPQSAINPSAAPAEPADEFQPQQVERKQHSFDLPSHLASIPSKQS